MISGIGVGFTGLEWYLIVEAALLQVRSTVATSTFAILPLVLEVVFQLLAASMTMETAVAPVVVASVGLHLV